MVSMIMYAQSNHDSYHDNHRLLMAIIIKTNILNTILTFDCIWNKVRVIYLPQIKTCNPMMFHLIEPKQFTKT